MRLVVALLAFAAGCGGVRPPQTPKPPVVVVPPFAVALVVTDQASGRPIEAARITSNEPSVPVDGMTGRAGQWSQRFDHPGFELCASSVGYVTACEPIAEHRNKAALLRLAPLVVPPTHPPVDRMVFRGNFANLYDSDGWIVYTPALPGAPEVKYQEWTKILRAAGTTHIPFGPLVGGPAYPGVHFANPDYWSDLPAFRRFVERVIADGFCPVIFIGEDRFADSHANQWPDLARALDGLHDKIIILAAWEPVIGGWTSRQVADAWVTLHRLFPTAILAGHGSPTRWVASSNPIEPDDPWQGAESDSLKTHGGEFVSMWFYQTPHGRDIYGGDCDEERDECWLNRWQDGVARLGAGFNGWRRLQVVLYESVAYEAFRETDRAKQPAMSEAARRIATYAKRICDKWRVSCGWGNGIPADMALR